MASQKQIERNRAAGKKSWLYSDSEKIKERQEAMLRGKVNKYLTANLGLSLEQIENLVNDLKDHLN
jgi:hypothetical protein